MKQMRSRFRLLTLLLACAFLVVIVLCTGHVLKNAGISLSSLSIPLPGVSASPDPSVSPDLSPAPNTTPDPSALPSETSSEDPAVPGTDNPPEVEYNVTGL